MEQPLLEDDGTVGAVEGARPERAGRDDPDRYAWILPVLFVEFLAVAVTKSLLPERLNAFFGDDVYLVLGAAETAKGVLAFFSCPAFGRLSDAVGRAPCLLVTVAGTTAPCWVLALTDDLRVYVGCLALSGLCASTFTLVFAYISDCVPPRGRAGAYGAALATLGLSFTVGPLFGAWLAGRVGDRRVFLAALVLAALDVAFIGLCLPESRPATGRRPELWDPQRTLSLLRHDDFLRKVSEVVLLYYTGVWALVTTLSVYVVRVFGLDAVQVGWLLSLYGLCTMVSEALLVRALVPRWGEVATMRVGLLAFAGQCALVAVADSPRLVFLSVGLSLLSNLVYPAVSALVARRVPPGGLGEALGAVNGVKALTEGLGPLVFAALMVEFEATPLPGTPYFGCAAVSVLAWAVTYRLPSERAADAAAAGEAELVGLLADTDDEDLFKPAEAPRKPASRFVDEYRPPLRTHAGAFHVARAARAQ